MKGEYNELVDLKKELSKLDSPTKNPFTKLYNKHKKKKIIDECSFEYCTKFLYEMNYFSVRQVCNLFNSLNDGSYKYNEPFYDRDYNRDLQMSDLRVIMGEYYVELHIKIDIKNIPLVTENYHLTSMNYRFLFSREGQINIERDTMFTTSGGSNKVTVDGRYTKGFVSGIYEYFIIENTFYKALKYYIRHFLND